MVITDANIILRYLLKDDEVFFFKSRVIIERDNIFIPFEVCAEVIYVLEKVYKVPRTDIQGALILLFDYPNISTVDKSIFFESLKVFETEKIDFVDSMLVAYHRIKKVKIHTFDKKLLKICSLAD